MPEHVSDSADDWFPLDWQAGLAQRRAALRDGSAYRAAFEAATEVVEHRYEGGLSSFIAGSYAVGDASEYSDVDVFVIDDRFANPAREQIVYDGYPLQIGAMSMDYALGRVEAARRRSSRDLVTAFAVGRKLTGSDELFARIKSAAEEAIAQGPKPRETARIARARNAMINNYVKLARPRGDPAEIFGSCMKLMQTAALYIQVSAGAWAINEIKHEPVLRGSAEYRRMIACVPAALQGDTAELLAAARAMLEARGPFVWGTEEWGLLPFSNQG